MGYLPDFKFTPFPEGESEIRVRPVLEDLMLKEITAIRSDARDS